MKRKILVTLLAFCLIASLCVVGAAADDVVVTTEESLKEAISSANDADVIVLGNDIEITDTLTINKDVSINLGGHTLTADDFKSGSATAILINGGSVYLYNGTIVDERGQGNASCGYRLISIEGQAALTTENLTLNQYYAQDYGANYNYAIFMLDGNTEEDVGTLTLNSGTRIIELENGDVDTYGVVGVAVFSYYEDGAAVPVDYRGQMVTVNEGVTIETTGFAITGNGANHGTTFIINGGTLISEESTAIYHPQAGNLVINGGYLSGGNCGIEIRAGDVQINGGTIVSTADDFSCDANGNGSTTAGVAVAISQHTTKLGITVDINDGTFEGVRAINEENPQNNVPTPQIDLTIDGGTYQGEVFALDVDGFVAGGTFSSSVAAYVADGLEYEANSNGVYTYHRTIESAVAAAGNSGGSVSMISDGTVVDETTGGHTITLIDGGSEITMTVTDGYVYTLPELDKNGYTFTGWRVNDSNTIVKGGESYPITANTTFTAVWNMIMIPDTYDIAVDQPAHGTVDVSFSNASQGSVITVTATPDEGYELVYITVDGEPISGNSFVMPDHAVEVSALFAEIGKEVNFVDVSRADWFYDYVQYVAQNGLMEGTTRTAFEPNASMTRAMFWTVLARIDGETITGDAWKTLAQTWAVESGISDGTNADALITREQMVTMLYRYAGSPVTGGMAISEFTDGASVSDYATDAVTWALSEGILTGMGDGILAPQGTATRAQAAAMLMRFVEA